MVEQGPENNPKSVPLINYISTQFRVKLAIFTSQLGAQLLIDLEHIGIENELDELLEHRDSE